MTEIEGSQVVLAGPQGDPLIRKTPGVCGGEACIGKSRIPVWIVVSLKLEGAPDVEILEGYPTLLPNDLEAAWEYYRLHQEEIDEAIRSNQEDEE